MSCSAFSGVPGFYALDASEQHPLPAATAKDMCRHCPVSPSGGQNTPTPTERIKSILKQLITKIKIRLLNIKMLLKKKKVSMYHPENERRLILGSVLKQGFLGEVALKQKPVGREGAGHMRNDGLNIPGKRRSQHQKGPWLFEDQKEVPLAGAEGPKGEAVQAETGKVGRGQVYVGPRKQCCFKSNPNICAML